MKKFIEVFPILITMICVISFMISVVDGYHVTPTDVLIIAVLQVSMYGIGQIKKEKEV